jgi:zinc/manganese transport system ATP-binding protein
VTIVEFASTTIALGGRAVLEDVTLAIRDGEFVGVFGPNGAGKTTLLRAILGLIAPSAGTITVFGAAARRGNAAIGYLPQSRSAAADLRLRGWDFVACVADGGRWGWPALDAAGRREIARVLELVGGTELATRPLGALSGGERQRLLLAQALLGRPRLLLLDEPLISLDLHHQETVVSLAKSLQTDLGITVLFSAHELNALLGVLDRVLYLGQGRAALGTVDEIVTGTKLSTLYQAPIEVLRLGSRIFVMSGTHEIERDEHHHDV